MAANFRKMSRAQLERHIRTEAKDSSKVFLTAHARIRMSERKVLAEEVLLCLQNGKIQREPEEDLKRGTLVCRMECYGASRNLTVAVALDEADPTLIVVTVITRKD